MTTTNTREMIHIISPIATNGQSVWAHNYRSKRKDGTQLWEQGKCTGATYCPGSGYWSYSVRLNRRSKTHTVWGGRVDGGNFLDLYVGDDGISQEKPL